MAFHAFHGYVAFPGAALFERPQPLVSQHVVDVVQRGPEVLQGHVAPLQVAPDRPGNIQRETLCFLARTGMGNLAFRFSRASHFDSPPLFPTPRP